MLFVLQDACETHQAPGSHRYPVAVATSKTAGCEPRNGSHQITLYLIDNILQLYAYGLQRIGINFDIGMLRANLQHILNRFFCRIQNLNT